MRYKPKDRLERIRDTIDSNPRVSLDQLDTKKLYFPNFKEEDRSKWLTKQGFSFDGFKQRKTTFWKEINNNCKSGINLYTDGL